MDDKLREALSDMSDEDFYELKRNIELTDTLRELMRGENAYTEEYIMKKFDFSAYDMMYVMTGAYDFTVRHAAIIDVMVRDKEILDLDEDFDDPADSDLPEGMNYGVLQDGKFFDRETGEFIEDEEVKLGKPRQLTIDEQIEMELEEQKSKVSEPTLEEIGKEINRKYLEKMEKEGKEGEKDSSIVNFD